MTNLTELRALLEKATPGEWKDFGPKLWSDELVDVYGWDTPQPRAKTNGELIVALRNDAPALLDEVERLRERVAELRNALNHIMNQTVGVPSELAYVCMETARAALNTKEPT